VALLANLHQGADSRYHAQGVQALVGALCERGAGSCSNARVSARQRAKSGTLFGIKADDSKAQGKSVGSDSGIAHGTAGRGNAGQLAKGGDGAS
jgi:hypothetical protein